MHKNLSVLVKKLKNVNELTKRGSDFGGEAR